MGSEIVLGIRNSTIIRQSSSHGRQLVVLMLFMLFATTANCFCPAKCICDSNATVCINAGLGNIPIQLNPSVKHINLTENKINTIIYSLTNYVDLETLDLTDNLIDTLGTKNFLTQERLKKLYVRKNVIKKLFKDAFKGLVSLQVLDLSYNRIAEMDPQTFSDLTGLQTLDLTNNTIVSVDAGVFKNMISLETLIFTNNELLSVPYSENFEYLRRLKRLDLSRNLIKQIANDSFHRMSELRSLNLNGNVINETDTLAFDGLVQLQFLDLSENALTVSLVALTHISNLWIKEKDQNFHSLRLSKLH